MSIYFLLAMSAILFVLYWCLLSKLVDAVLDAPRLKTAHWILVGAGNACAVFFVMTTLQNLAIAYLTMMVVMFVEFLIFYKDNVSGALLCTLSCALHVMACFMLVVAGIAMLTGVQSYLVLENERSLFTCIAYTFLILDVVIVCVLKVIPLPMVKLINQHTEQRWFIMAWIAVNLGFLMHIATTFGRVGYPSHLLGTPMVASVVSLISLYIVLFFSIKTSTILGYKEKNVALEHAIFQEQLYRNSIAMDAIATYEINISKDRVISGCEYMLDEIGDTIYNYGDMMKLVAHKFIHSEDMAEFTNAHTKENMIKMFRSGKHEVIIEYRRILHTGEYAWARAITNIVEDAETGDLKAFIFVKNIDTEKRNQLELQRQAERDPLTGLYNKGMTGKRVDEYVLFNQRMTNSALFMIDVDNFKAINDYLGHMYGDAVLCELADKLTDIFRSTDIVGRIGGDEFIVFMRDNVTMQSVMEKAEEICKAFSIAYSGMDGNKYAISSSVGISLFPKDGTSFGELYGNADIALYAAKSGGKNKYHFFDGSNFKGYEGKRTEIQTVGEISQKGFRQNRIEYVFKILYESENPVEAIHTVLELVARHFSFERGYIFENSKDGKTTSNTFEWCAEGVTQERGNLQNLPIEMVATASSHFQKGKTFVLKNLDELTKDEREMLEQQGIKSMFQFAMFDKTRWLGLIGFDNCESEVGPGDTVIDEMQTICNILATFFVKQYIDEVSARDLLARQEIMNHLSNYIYVINMETFEVLFMNDKIQKLVNETDENLKCYNVFRGNNCQCINCPLPLLGNSETSRAVSEIYNDKLGIWMEVIVSSLRWTDGTLACLLNCSDITKKKEDHRLHVQQLENALYVDELTGCPTYHKFKEDGRRILAEEPNKIHLLVKLDMDNFKLVNKIYGYEKGDEVLRRVAKALEMTLRNENEIFARVSNDEFVVLFSIETLEEIDILNKAFLDHFNQLMGAELPFACGFPHGRHVIYPADKEKADINDMFEKANIAHKAAKRDKNMDFLFYEDAMTHDAMHSQEVESKMAKALENNEFLVYLQPKYCLQDETIGGAEALARWDNENKALFYPNAFIPIFEKNGFVTKLDFYIFRKVCEMIKDWEDAGIQPVVVSVNFSRLHLNNAHFVKELCQIVDSVGIDRKYLEIEVTETVIYDHIDILEGVLDELHKDGFSMSMDDFGTGYSSLGMLKNLPVDVIKMDRSFFSNQRDVTRSQTVVSGIIQMAAGLGVRIVAEGVEDQVHIDFLRAMECDMVQGYYYSKPITIEEFVKLLKVQH